MHNLDGKHKIVQYTIVEDHNALSADDKKRGTPEFSGKMIGWVLRGVSVGSHGYS